MELLIPHEYVRGHVRRGGDIWAFSQKDGSRHIICKPEFTGIALWNMGTHFRGAVSSQQGDATIHSRASNTWEGGGIPH